MPREFPRSRRIEEQIQRILSDVLREARDPRLQQAVITGVRVSRDLSVAWIYIKSLDPTHQATELEQGFQHAAGFLRSALARELTVRQVPELRFNYDDVLERAADMDALIDSAVARDRRAAGEDNKDDTDD